MDPWRDSVMRKDVTFVGGVNVFVHGYMSLRS